MVMWGSNQEVSTQWRRQPKKSGGPKLFSLLVSSKIYNIHAWDPLYIKKLFNGFALISGGVRTERGGPDPSFPRGDATECCICLYYPSNSSIALYIYIQMIMNQNHNYRHPCVATEPIMFCFCLLIFFSFFFIHRSFSETIQPIFTKFSGIVYSGVV